MAAQVRLNHVAIVLQRRAQWLNASVARELVQSRKVRREKTIVEDQLDRMRHRKSLGNFALIGARQAKWNFRDRTHIGESPLLVMNAWKSRRFKSRNGRLTQPLQPRMGGKRGFLLEVAEVAHVAR